MKVRLTRVATLAITASATSIINSGKETSNVLDIYAKSFLSHLGVLEASDFDIALDQTRSLQGDTAAFLNLIEKLSGDKEAPRQAHLNEVTV